MLLGINLGGSQVVRFSYLLYILFFVAIYSTTTFAVNIPGEVPLFDITKPEARLPAIDLVYNGKVLSAEKLKKLETQWIKNRRHLKNKNLSEQDKEVLRQSTISKLSPAPQDIQRNWVDKLFLVDDGLNYDEKNGVDLLRGDNTKKIFEKLDNIFVESGDTLDFIDLGAFKANQLFDFRVSKEVGSEPSSKEVTFTEKTQYRIFLGPTTHNIMLRKTLLRKLGFKEDGFKYLSNIKIKFINSTVAIKFLDGSLNGRRSGASSGFGLSNNTNEDPMRWVTNIKRIPDPTQDRDPETGEFKHPVRMIWDFSKATNSEDEVILELQDVVIYKETSGLRLSIGNLQHDRHKRKRIYNSLLLAYNLIDIPESVNSLSPIPFNITKQEIVLTHGFAGGINEFSPDIYDLKWMARKLSSFSRKDFEHLVEEAYYPKEVALILTELLIARRNYIQKYFFANDIDCVGALAYKKLPYYCLGESTAKTHPEMSAQFEVDLNISYGKRLVNGKLKVDTRGAEYNNPDKWWVGYGTRFSFHDQESPLVFSEIVSYFRSILRSSVLDTLINKHINSKLMVDNADKISAELLKKAIEQGQFEASQIAAEVAELNGVDLPESSLKAVPVGFFTVPTASAQLLMNRNIVIGSQSGVDNQIQLVDTFGYIIKGGLHTEVTRVENLDLLNNFENSGRGFIGFDLDYSIMRRWVHLRPIKVIKLPGAEDLVGPIKKSLDESYSKLIIPKMLRDFRKEVDDLPAYDPEASDEEKAAYKEILLKNNETLNKYLKVGESLIITNSIGPAFEGEYKQNFTASAQLVFKFIAESEDISRVHIVRESENKLVIYKTKANQIAWEVKVDARKFIPIASVGFKRKSGQAQTWFHTINNFVPEIEQDLGGGRDETVINPSFQEGLKVLIETLGANTFQDSYSYSDKNLKINQLYTPYVIKHKFKQNQLDFRLFFLNESSQTMADEIDVFSPYKPSFPKFSDGETTRYLRVSRGTRHGNNFQALAQDIVNYILNKNDIDGQIRISSSNDPADTLYGKSQSVSVVLDARVTEPNPGVLADINPVFEDPFLKLHFTWKGGVDQGLSKKRVKKLVKGINKKLDIGIGPLFNLDELSKVERLQLYRVGIDLVIYKEGFFKLFELSPWSFEKHIYKHLLGRIRHDYVRDTETQIQEKVIKPMSDSLKRSKEFLRENKTKEFSKEVVWLIVELQKTINFKGFIDLFENIPENNADELDAVRNFYIKGYLTGFRKGDERISPILANEVGMPRKKSVNGSSYDHTFGELEYIKNRLGISDGEFYLNWILRSFL